MSDPRKNTRDIYPATGPEMTAKHWTTEAPLRMLMNNLHPDVAENPRMAPVPALESLTRDYNRRPLMITNPRLAPSTVTTEQAFQARNLLAPQFQHNALATRMARTSNLYAEAPRFRNQLDILA